MIIATQAKKKFLAHLKSVKRNKDSIEVKRKFLNYMLHSCDVGYFEICDVHSFRCDIEEIKSLLKKNDKATKELIDDIGDKWLLGCCLFTWEDDNVTIVELEVESNIVGTILNLLY